MDMKTVDIIKVLLILGVLYLLFNCEHTENFADEITRIRLALLSEGKAYRLVSFFDLKDEYRLLLLTELNNQYKTELDKNIKESDPIKRTSNSFFLFGGSEDALVNIFTADSDDKIKVNLGQLRSDAISKVPVIIISNDNVDKYTTTISDFGAPYEESKRLSLTPGKRLYWNQAHSLMFSSSNERVQFQIKGLHKNTDKNKFEIEPVKLDDKDITPNKLAEKIIKIGDLSLTHYILSNDAAVGGKDFSWKWYTDDLSKIQ